MPREFSTFNIMQGNMAICCRLEGKLAMKAPYFGDSGIATQGSHYDQNQANQEEADNWKESSQLPTKG
jgi:hypothetical protein